MEPKSTMPTKLLIKPVVRGATVAALPLMGVQGLWVRLRTPVLPEAGPPFTGVARQPTGEPTAAGVGATCHGAGLAGCTAAALAAHLDAPVAWHAHGRSGATVASVRRELLPTVPLQHAEIVLIALGVNDTIRRTPPAAWYGEMAALVDDVRVRLRPAQIILAGVPPMARFPALPSPLRQFLGARSVRLDGELARLAATTPAVRHCPTPLPEPHHFASDRFHPGPEGYAAWGEVVARCLG
jgi:lysophospholipase L1-like esterase